MISIFAILIGGGVVFLLYKASDLKMFQNIKYEMDFNNIGFLGIIADIMNKKKNKLDEIPSKKGEVAVVTGGTRGIGLHVVQTLIKCEMQIVMGARNLEAANKVIQDLKNDNKDAKITLFQLDTSSMKSVESFWKNIKERFPEVHLLVNNAGILRGDFKLTEDGFETQLATNYMGHFYLTHLLLENLKKAGEKSGKCARIVNVSSCMHYGAKIDFDDINMEKSYNATGAYAISKLAQLMSTRSINKRFETEGLPVKCFAAHPGLVATDMFFNSAGAKSTPWLHRFLKTPEQGSIPILHCCLSSKLEENGGAYISNGEEGYSTSYSNNTEQQERLFELSCRMLKISKFGTVESK